MRWASDARLAPRLRPGRPLVALLLTGLAGLAIAAGLRAWCAPERLAVAGGVVRRGSIVHATDDLHRFVIDQAWGVPGALRDGVGVVYRGVWPDTVCAETDVVIRGHVFGGRIDAVDLLGASGSKYDPCRAWFCRPDGERPPRCRSRGSFE